MLGYREYYNKTVLPMEPLEFRDIKLYFQMSTYAFFFVGYDGQGGYTHQVMVLDPHRKSKFLDDIRPMEHLNGKNRRDLLRLWLHWNGHYGKTLTEDEAANLVSDLVPICRRYNNVIILGGQYEMTFEDFKDLSRRKIRIRSTQDKGPEYYRPDLLPVYEERLANSIPLLDSLKRQLVECLDENQSDQILSLAHKVVGMMQMVEHDSRYVRELREAMEYIGTQ